MGLEAFIALYIIYLIWMRSRKQFTNTTSDGATTPIEPSDVVNRNRQN